jgi:hypothetical protein
VGGGGGGGALASQLSSPTFYSLLNLLTTLSASCDVVARQLLDGDLLAVVTRLLARSPLLPGAGSSGGAGGDGGDVAAGGGGTASGGGGAAHGAVLRSTDQLADVMSLLVELLPPLASPTELVQRENDAFARRSGGDDEKEKGRGDDDDAGDGEVSTDARAGFFEDSAAATHAACSELLPLVLQLHSSTVIPHVSVAAYVGLGLLWMDGWIGWMDGWMDGWITLGSQGNAQVAKHCTRNRRAA